jgi:hypothetical protein
VGDPVNGVIPPLAPKREIEPLGGLDFRNILKHWGNMPEVSRPSQLLTLGPASRARSTIVKVLMGSIQTGNVALNLATPPVSPWSRQAQALANFPAQAATVLNGLKRIGARKNLAWIPELHRVVIQPA